MTAHRLTPVVAAIVCVGLLTSATNSAPAQQSRPNILLIMSDDVGQDNISAYSHGIVG
jgi:arylsulfatase